MDRGRAPTVPRISKDPVPGATPAPAALVTRRMAAKGWLALGHTPPTEDPELDRIDAGEALMWSVVSSSVVRLVRLGARCLVAKACRKAGKGAPLA